MTTGTCQYCGAMVQFKLAKRVRGGVKVEEWEPHALPGQHAHASLAIHLSKCPQCGAPRLDTRTMEQPPTADTIHG